MQLSRWCHTLHQDGVSALVNALTLGVVYISTEELRAFMEALPSSDNVGEVGLIEILTAQGLLVENQTTDELVFARTRERLRSEMSLELLYLLVTDGCNLRCTYCFEETPSLTAPFHSTQMTKETVIRALDLFARMTARHGNPEKKKVIHLYGGEPLANRKAVYEAVFYVDELKSRGILSDSCQIAIVTNGVLLKEEDARLFATHNVTVGLSIDGPASVTDFYRIPKRRDVRVTERITSAFRLLKRHNVSIGLSVTLTPQAIERFDEFVAFFTDGEFREVDGVSLNLLHFSPNLILPDDYYHAAVECQIKFFKRFREAGLYEERVMRKVRAFVDQEPMYADCGVVGRQLVVAPDGRIGVCQDFVKPRTYFPRSVYDVEHHDLLEALFADWRDRSPFFMPQCRDCLAISICGGGCPASAELKTGSRYNLDERACHHSKQILEWLVWDAYAKLDG
ncbi:MAG: radical SAM protein [Patescibacteria group bacterium]|nr:radical SAM protein [Patescibacteria group bacterium]